MVLTSVSLFAQSMVLAFIPCELGERMSDATSGINDSIDQFDWHSFPVEIQKILPTVLIGVQQPIEIRCFGSIACTRETFKQVRS